LHDQVIRRKLAPAFTRLVTMSKKKLTKEQKAAKAKRKAEWMTIFIRGKQVSVRRPILIDGLDPETFLEQNADPIWLLQEGRYEALDSRTSDQKTDQQSGQDLSRDWQNDEIPF
jgi:hypothetical protein